MGPNFAGFYLGPTYYTQSGLLHTGYSEEGGADIFAQGTPYDFAQRRATCTRNPLNHVGDK